MHENPRATEEEQDLAQTKRMREEEAMRGGLASIEEVNSEEDADAEEDANR